MTHITAQRDRCSGSNQFFGFAKELLNDMVLLNSFCLAVPFRYTLASDDAISRKRSENPSKDMSEF